MTVARACDCDCHRDPNVRHIMQCCDQSPAGADLKPLPWMQTRPIAGQDALPEDGAYIIVFEDAEVPDERFVGAGAKEAALRRYDMISMSWNAHLYVKVDSNHIDCAAPNAVACQTHARAEPAYDRTLLAAMLTYFLDHCRNRRYRDEAIVEQIQLLLQADEAAAGGIGTVRATGAAAPSVPDGLPGELVEMGTDDAGAIRALVLVTRDAARHHGAKLLYKPVLIIAANNEPPAQENA